MELLRSQSVRSTVAKPFDLLRLLALRVPTRTPFTPLTEETHVEPNRDDAVSQDSVLSATSSTTTSTAATSTTSSTHSSAASTVPTLPTASSSIIASAPKLLDNASCYEVVQLSKAVYAAPDATMEQKHLDAWAQIRSRLEDTLLHTYRPKKGSDATVSIEFMMAGPNPSSSALKPSVVLVCCSPDNQTLLKKILKSQKWLSEYDYYFLVIVDRLWELSGDDDLGGDQCDDGPLVEAWNMSQTSTMSGVLARSRLDANNATLFTIGGVIMLDGSPYALTAGHVFFQSPDDSGFESGSPATASGSMSDGEDITDYTDDDDDDDDDSPFVSFTASSKDRPIENPPQEGEFGFSSTIDRSTTIQSNVLPQSYGSAILGRPSPIGHVCQFRAISDSPLDWALIRCCAELPSTANTVTTPGTGRSSSTTQAILGIVSDTQLQDHRSSSEVWLNCGISGVVRGRIRNSPVSLLLRGRVCEVWQVLIDTPLVPGDSGSWVIRDGKVCGHIIATRDVGPFAYMLSMDAIISDVKAHTGSTADFVLPQSPPSTALPLQPASSRRNGLLDRFRRLRPHKSLSVPSRLLYGTVNDRPTGPRDGAKDQPTSRSSEDAAYSPMLVDLESRLSAPSPTSISDSDSDSFNRNHVLHLPGSPSRSHNSSDNSGQFARESYFGLHTPVYFGQPSSVTRTFCETEDDLLSLDTYRKPSRWQWRREDWKPLPLRPWYINCLIIINIAMALTLIILHKIWAVDSPSNNGDVKSKIQLYLVGPAAILAGLLCESVDSALARLYPFYQMSNAETWTTANHSVNLDYASRNPLTRLIGSLSCGHFPVAGSSFATLLSAVLIPALCMDILDFWTDDQTSPDQLHVGFRELHVKIAVTAMVIVAIYMGALLLWIRRNRTGLYGEIKGIAGIAAMASGPGRWAVREERLRAAFCGSDHKPLAEFHRDVKFRAVFAMRHGQLEVRRLEAIHEPEVLNRVRDPLFGRILGAFGMVFDHLFSLISRLLIGNDPPDAALALVGRLVCILVLLFVPLLLWSLSVSAIFNLTGQNLALLCARLIWNQLDSDLRLVHPWYRLKSHQTLSSTVFQDLNTLPSIWVVLIALQERRWILFLTSSVSGGLPALLIALSWFSAPVRIGDSLPPADTRPLIPATFTLILLSLLATVVTIYRIRPNLPRHPASISSVLGYTYQSSIGREFFDRDNKHRLRYKYGFGWFRGRDGGLHCGIECETELLEDYHFGQNQPRWEHGRRRLDLLVGP